MLLGSLHLFIRNGYFSRSKIRKPRSHLLDAFVGAKWQILNLDLRISLRIGIGPRAKERLGNHRTAPYQRDRFLRRQPYSQRKDQQENENMLSDKIFSHEPSVHYFLALEGCSRMAARLQRSWTL